MNNRDKLVKLMWEALDESPFVMVALDGVNASHSQPMTAQIDEDFNDKFYFFTNKQNRLVKGISETNNCIVNLSAKGHKLFACVHGKLALENDTAMIDRLWSPIVSAWYEDGKEDADLALIRFDLDHAEIWDASTSSFLKSMVAAVVTGTAEEVSQNHVVKVKF